MRKRFLLWMLSATASWGLFAQNAGMSLSEMFAIADSLNSSIKVSTLSLREAESSKKDAERAFLPSIEASVSMSYLGDGYIMDRDFGQGFKAEIPSFGNNFKLEVSQVIYAGGALRTALQLSELGREIARLSADKNRNEVHFLIAGNYIELCKLRHQLQVIDSNIDLSEKVMQQMDLRAQQGTALSTDVGRIQLLLENLHYTRLQLEGAEDIIKEELATSLGLDSLPEIAELDSLVPNSEDSLSWLTLSLENSPVLHMSKTLVAVAEREASMAKAGRLPQVYAFAGDYLDGPVTIEIPAIDKNFNYWAVGIGVRYQISSLYKNQQKIAKSRLAVERQEEAAKMAEENISLAVKAAIIDYQNSFKLLETKEKSLSLAEDNYQLMNERYREGLVMLTDLIEVSNQLLDAQMQCINAKMNINYQYYKLAYISGNI